MPPVALPHSQQPVLFKAVTAILRFAAYLVGVLPLLWPDDWERFTSFTGSVYYISDGGRLITTDDVHDPHIRELVLEVYEMQRDWFKDIDADDAEIEVFNVCDQPMVILASWSLGETYEYSTDDLKPERRAAFWDYAWEFSAHRKYLPRHLEAEFITALAFVSNGNDLVPALIYHIGRVMFSIASARDLNNYGTLVDQTEGSGTAKEPTQWGVAAWNFCLAIILLGTHENYRLRLEAIVPKGTINLPKFRHLVRNLLSEWADSNLVATVIVSVNVGFLGVNGASGIQRSASLVSSICATISLITGVHHVWQHREKTDTEREDAKEYLYFFALFTPRGACKAPPTTLDLAFTAALLAVPLALLVWAVLSFAVAISAYAFERANHTLVLVVLGGLVALSGIMFAYFWGLNGWTSRMERVVERVGL
ncbi:hypothetical protein DFH08DRAFT_1022444 [Mycena albidolilacea]|uniref:Uncharacterized protein n=1 Tax=Mycena albidolilacea TaxID=1033008 RepID=A0AAD6ZMU6_9AGAR|nr:hypothetical protein DFH08DRAFT_1022444 [Mycena albidolilacea]